jgi:glycosyltransferase involved in cell wall biosynthesis
VRFDVVTGADTGLSRFDNVHTHRGIDDDTLAELYRNADVLLLPLTDSTANNALLEGMASGLPLVATDLPAVRAYLPEGGIPGTGKLSGGVRHRSTIAAAGHFAATRIGPKRAGTGRSIGLATHSSGIRRALRKSGRPADDRGN